jgi:hypothetical protein
VAYRLKVLITSPVTMFSGPPRHFLSAFGLPLSNLREIILRSMPQIIELRLSPLCKVEGPEGDFANSAAKSGFELKARWLFGAVADCLPRFERPLPSLVEKLLPLVHRRLRVSCLIQPWKIARLRLRNAGRSPSPKALAPERYACVRDPSVVPPPGVFFIRSHCRSSCHPAQTARLQYHDASDCHLTYFGIFSPVALFVE